MRAQQITVAAQHEAKLARTRPGQRKANGVYYTPLAMVDHVIRHTLGSRNGDPWRMTILDPACGCGSFLVAAYQWLLDAHSNSHGSPTAAVRTQLLRNCIFGVDLDAAAVAIARRTLAEIAGEPSLDLTANIQHGNALLGPDFAASCRDHVDWPGRFPAVMADGGFTAVIGNPPWGQKQIAKNDRLKRYLWQRYPSSAGIFDLYRPFVELGVRLTAHGGCFGMVLPDIILLKNYEQTRRFLLDQLTLDRIDWWGKAFAGATIDTVTILGRKRPAPPRHSAAVSVVRGDQHTIPQETFRANPRHVFNLHWTAGRQRVLDRLASFPRLGDFFEIHEGVHSGNIRDELFVDSLMDRTCRPLLFGRDEIAPYRLQWKGRYVRLGAMPSQRTRQRYANVGRREWHEREKLLVRRTGDRVLAAADREGRWASNNFFLVFPKRSCALELDGLCALLNSQFMTWYFRVIEPRQGRAFAELKIKHLSTFPLPPGVAAAQLNRLGRQRCEDATLDAGIDETVRELFGVRESD